MRVVDAIVAALAERGVRDVFGVGGANIEDFYDALAGSPVRGVVAKHEFSAATMADGCARVTGGLGVVVATSGGGMTNLVSGLAEAHASRTPVLALVGQPPTASAGRGAFQDSSGLAGSFDAVELFAPISRFCARVGDPAEISGRLRQALGATVAGPAVLLLPKDVQQAQVGGLVLADAADAVVAADPAERARVAAALCRAGPILVIAGEGAARARGELAELAGRLGTWVAVTPDAKDVFDNNNPRFAGVAGVLGHPNVAACLREARLCLLVGTRLPAMARGGLEGPLAGTPVVSVGAELPHTEGLALVGDVRKELRALLELIAGPTLAAPPHAGPVPLSVPEAAGLCYAEVVDAVAAALPHDAHVFVDAGNACSAAIHRVPASKLGRFVVAVGMGGMGYSFGAGIGAALATGRRTYVIAGDGAFFMHGLEVHTAIEHRAPVTFVVLNNNAHAMCLTREQLYYDGLYSFNRFRPADIAAGVAAMFPGLPAASVSTASQMRGFLADTNDRAGPSFVSADFEPGQTPPFLPFLKGIDHEHRRIDVG